MKSIFSNAHRFAPLSLLVLLGLTAGCGTLVTVDSLAKPGANTISYELRDANSAFANNSVSYKQAAKYVRTALSGRGMFEAPRGVKPDVIVSVQFGIGQPQSRRERRSEPIYRDVPARTRTEYITVADANGNNVSERVTYEDAPTVEVSGYRDVMVNTTIYEKYLRLVAREASSAGENHPPAEIWLVDVTSEGESRDLRKHLPLLVAASIDYIGRDSQGQKKIRIRDSDADVHFIKKGMPAVAAAPK